MLNLRRTLTSINPYEVQTLSGRLLNRQCLNQKVKAVAQQLKWNSQLQDCNAFHSWWQFFAKGQKPVSFVEQQRRKMASRGFVDRIKNQNAAKFLQLFTIAELKGQGNVYDQMYDDFVSCFTYPQPGPCPTKKMKRHLPRKAVKVVTAVRPSTRNEGQKLKPIFKINPALLPYSTLDKRKIRFKDVNIRTKPGAIFKSWISNVGIAADTSREDSVELDAMEKPEDLKTDAKPDDLQQSVKPEDLIANIQPEQLQQNVKPQGLKPNAKPEKLQQIVEPEKLKYNVKPKQLKNNVKGVKLQKIVKPEDNVKLKQFKYNIKKDDVKHNVSVEKKHAETLIPEIPKPIEPTKDTDTYIPKKEVTYVAEKEGGLTQKEIELAEIALLEEQARRRKRRLIRSHSEPNLKSKNFKHHKNHAQKKKSKSSRRTGSSNLSDSIVSIRSTHIKNIKKYQNQARLQGLFKYRLSTSPKRYSSQSIDMRKSLGRGSTMSRTSTMSRASIKYRVSVMATSPGSGKTTSPAIAAAPAESRVISTAPRPAPVTVPLPLPIINGPVTKQKQKQRTSIPSIRPTIYISKKSETINETSRNTSLKTNYSTTNLRKFTSDPLPIDFASISSIDSPTKPAENDWSAVKLPKMPSILFWKLSSSHYEPSHEIFENFLQKFPPIDVKQHVHDFMAKNNISFDMFHKVPRNWPLPFESKLVRRMRSEKCRSFNLSKINRKPKKTEKIRRKKVPQKPQPEPELLKVPSCEICRNFYPAEPDQPYMIEMKKRQAREELKRYYRRRLMAQSPNSQTFQCGAAEKPCGYFSSVPEPNKMEMKLRQVREELKRYRRSLPTESQTVRGCAPEKPYVHFGSRPETNMFEMRRQQVRDELKSRRLSTSSLQMARDCSHEKPFVHFGSQAEPSSEHKPTQLLRPSLVHLMRKQKEKQTMRQKLVECYKMLCDCETLLDNKLKQLQDHERCL